MLIELTEDEEFLRRSTAEFVEKEIMPQASTLDEEARFPRELFQKLGDLGYFGIRYPEEVGGSGATFTAYCVACEELARGSLAVASIMAMQSLMATDFLFRYGGADVKERLLKPALKGEKVGAFTLTEPGAGSDLQALKTTAIKQGDTYVLNGSKTWATSATVADFFTVLAKTDPAGGLETAAFFLVERETAGLTVGKPIHKLGVRCSKTSELTFDEVVIPASNLLGAEGKGFSQLKAILNEIRVMTGALALGVLRAAMDDALRYARERVQFGRAIIKFQAIRHKFADMATDLAASKLLVYRAARLVDDGASDPALSAIAKLFATEAAVRGTDEASRVFASYGFAMEYPAQRYFRDARFLLFGGGTTEILKNIIAALVESGAGG